VPGLYTCGRATVVAAVVLTAGAGVTAATVSAPSSAHVVSMATAGRTRAGLVVTSGTSFLDISVARLDGTLLRASTPAGAPARPVLSGWSPVVLSLTGDQLAPGRYRSTGYVVSVVLNSAVTWSLDLAGGTQRTNVNLRGGHVGAIAVTAGSDILDVSLPRPAGTVPFLFAGGASQFSLSLPGGIPVRVTARGGAGFLTVDGQSLTGVAGGTVLTSPGWATAPARFDVDATAGVSRLTVSRW
jgi:hypothetical protein